MNHNNLLIMKRKYTIVLFLMFFAGNLAYSQTVTESSPINVLDRITQTDTKPAIMVENKVINYTETLPLSGNTPEDSLNMQFREVSLNINSVRIDPSSLSVVFPEAVNVDSEGNQSVDYNSMISIMYEAILKQQKMIEELQVRVQSIEKN